MNAHRAEMQRSETLAPYADVYLPGITLDGLSLSGMTRAEAESAAEGMGFSVP